ncbi:hypothetical protein Ct61P_10452 [Colletotrichum tofieldiae]|nr:hypothetical protein Ct61P_10452 [Colletotrichum tofieldiae]
MKKADHKKNDLDEKMLKEMNETTFRKIEHDMEEKMDIDEKLEKEIGMSKTTLNLSSNKLDIKVSKKIDMGLKNGKRMPWA